jgi:hypothetical protein
MAGRKAVASATRGFPPDGRAGRIDPMAAHREFMKIDEYREILCREFLSSVME